MRQAPDRSEQEPGLYFDALHMKQGRRGAQEQKRHYRITAIVIDEYQAAKNALIWLWRERKNISPNSNEDDY